MNSPPAIILIAGPNGAGKTTFAREYLPNECHGLRFINVNLLAQGLSPFDPDAAAENARLLMRTEIQKEVQQRNSFAIETTLSNLSYARCLQGWQQHGYRVEIIFLGLAAPELSVARVGTRVVQGGHHVTTEEIRQRFAIGLHNFQTHYQPVVDAWVWYDNSSTQPVLIAAHEIIRTTPATWSHAAGLDGITSALQRAASRARHLARQTNTPLHYWQNGRLVSIHDPVLAEHCRVA